MKTKIFTLLFAIVANVYVCSAKVQIGDLYYTLYNGEATVTYQNHDQRHNYRNLEVANIPSSIVYEGNTYNVVGITRDAFKYCSTLKTVTIPEGITAIEASTFDYCTDLTSISLPNSLNSIEGYAFANCTSLPSITIPENVTNIAWDAFQWCDKLESVTVNSNALVSKEYNYVRRLDIDIIGSESFCKIFGSQVKNYIIGEGVTSIGKAAFSDCDSITSLSLPSSLESIGDYAFNYCRSVTAVTIPNGVTSIGISAFQYCNSLTSIVIPNGVTEIKQWAFLACSDLTSVSIPNGVSIIGYGAFGGCGKLTSITLPNALEEIGNFAFQGCGGLTSITIPNSVTYIGIDAFASDSSIVSVSISNNLTEIDEEVFYGCTSLTSVTIPNSVSMINANAFRKCTNLSSVIIGDGLTGIQRGAFRECDGLASVTCHATTPPAMVYEGGEYYDENVVFENRPQIPLYVPAGSVEAYKSAIEWQDFHPILPIGSSTPTTYTITFVNWDGEELLTLTDVEEGTIPTYTGVTPTRPDDDAYTYTFKGWSPAIVAASADATYTAQYEASPKGEGIEDIFIDGSTPCKVMSDGQIYILRGNQAYTLQGAEVK